MDSSDLNDLTRSSTTMLDTSALSDLLTFVTIASLILTVIIVIMWILNWMHRRKVQDAILDIQTTLHEINERDKSRSPVVPFPANDSADTGDH